MILRVPLAVVLVGSFKPRSHGGMRCGGRWPWTKLATVALRQVDGFEPPRAH